MNADERSKIRRFWDYGRPFRQRFGLLNGSALSWSLARAEYRAAAGDLVPIQVPGWPRPFCLRARTSDPAVFRQVLMGRELEVALDPAPRRILDGGMNFGLASLVFAHRWPDAQIVGVELEQGNAAAARRNCAELPAIRIIHGALWDTSGSVAVRDAGADAWSYQASANGDGIPVRAYRIAELLDELGWDQVDLVKLDIEGAERRVLADAPRWLPRVRHLLVELHDRFEPGCTDAFLAAVGGGDWSIREQGEYMLASRVTA
ncbi:MAG: FkbM family methyltransferase [Gemmatimonadales bacterium]|nr:FkbM family methyltransferase [Gemmatimonadales bacterium]MBP6570525.1 FkbM family methyltransferase [Gemmatimonadales bacterium]MBP7619855.1 FkbM family methyltransferase [Gemmatimonadales bacterium]MBP9898462.1 FkbM family methyltransferase [Gemmatimonadales bacterium]